MTLRSGSSLSFATFVLALFVVTLFAETPTATAAQGKLQAVSNKPLPGNKIIAVRPLDDSDESLKLMRRFEQALANLGYRVSPKSDLVLTFEIVDELGAYTVSDQRYFLELQARGSRTGGEDASARFNVFDSKTGGIINKGRGGTKVVTPSKYRLKVTVDGPAGPGRLDRYWQGTATGNLGASTNETLIGAMVQPLIDHLGTTVRNKSFPLPD